MQGISQAFTRVNHVILKEQCLSLSKLELRHLPAQIEKKKLENNAVPTRQSSWTKRDMDDEKKLWNSAVYSIKRNNNNIRSNEVDPSLDIYSAGSGYAQQSTTLRLASVNWPWQI